MVTLYKLTDKDGWTRRYASNGCLWGEGVTHSGTGEGGLCGPGYIHAYEHPLIAVLLNPIHADLADPILWEAEGEIAKRNGQLKCGCVSLTTIRKILLPEVTIEQRIRFAILCAKAACNNRKWNEWADKWLSGEDRSRSSARARAARVEAEAAREATWSAAEAAWAVEWVAARAAMAAEAAAITDLNLINIAEQAINGDKK